MMTKLLNTLGLVLGIIGGTMLYYWGPPQPNLTEGVSIGLEDNTPIGSTGKTVKQHNQEVREKAKKYARYSSIGLALITVGFIVQLIALWIPDEPAHHKQE